MPRRPPRRTATRGSEATPALAPVRPALPNLPAAGGAATAVAAAESQIGVPYVWGGESPGHGFDCSGLTQWAWRQAGVDLPRTAAAQYGAIPHVPLSDLQPGDLLFWGFGGISHVGMYVGGGDFINAPRDRRGGARRAHLEQRARRGRAALSLSTPVPARARRTDARDTAARTS